MKTLRTLYDIETGKIYAEVKDDAWFYFPVKFENGKYWILKEDGSVNVHIGLDVLETEESLAKKELCIDKIAKLRKVDDSGDNKYTVVGSLSKAKKDWQEKVELDISLLDILVIDKEKING